MNRLKYIFLLLVAVMCNAQARTPIRQWFVAMPDSVMPLLTKNNRLDFIDFLDSRMEAIVTNRLDGKSRMATLTDDYLLINYTKSCDVAMKLLPINDTTDVLCMVSTVRAMVDDSRVTFFDEMWRSLDAATLLEEPVLDDFRSAERGDSADGAWGKMDVFFKTYRLSPDDASMVCRLTTLDYLNEEDREAVLPYVSGDSLVFTWVEGRYSKR